MAGSSSAVLLLLGGLLLGRPAGGAVPSPPGDELDPCSLLTRANIESIQAGQLVETKRSDHRGATLSTSQCFYNVSPFNRSVSLEVTRNDSACATCAKPRTAWMKAFHPPAEKPADRKDEDGEREEHGRPQPLPGIGDEAFWVGSRMSGALYVLRGDSYYRLSLGGPESETVKIEKARRLASEMLVRLH